MGLSLSVGFLDELNEYDDDVEFPFPFNLFARWFSPNGDAKSFRAELRRLNRALRAAGLAEHSEPERVKEGLSCDLLGYSGLHYLRRVAAHDALGRGVPSPGQNNPGDDEATTEYYRLAGQSSQLPYSHLMQHSDAEGYYLPQDFQDVLFPSNHHRVAGHMVGSAPRLRAECMKLACLIELPTHIEPWSRVVDEAVQAQGEGEGWRRYGHESYVCLYLLHACDLRIKTGAAIVFH